MEEDSDEKVLAYYAEGITEYENRKIPSFLKWSYLLLPIWGLYAYFAYWNGSQDEFDKGHWKELQEAARTTYPFEAAESSEEKAYIRSWMVFRETQKEDRRKESF